MAKRKRNQGRDFDPAIDNAPRGAGGRKQILIPAENEPDAYRFMAKIREGVISGEVFCRDPERRRELGLPVIISEV